MLPFLEKGRPSTIIHKDHIHIINKRRNNLINLKKLLNKFDMEYKDITNSFFWAQERVIWIGFNKNSMNNECCFSRKEMSKDVVKLVLSFLREKF